jgi:hypothetical protein
MSVIIFQYFGPYIEIFGQKNSSLALLLVEVDTDLDPDRQALDVNPDLAK